VHPTQPAETVVACSRCAMRPLGGPDEVHLQSDAGGSDRAAGGGEWTVLARRAGPSCGGRGGRVRLASVDPQRSDRRLGRQVPPRGLAVRESFFFKKRKNLRRREPRREHRVVSGSSWRAWSAATSRSQATLWSPEVDRRPGQRGHDGEHGIPRRPARRQAAAQRVELAMDLGSIEAPGADRASGGGGVGLPNSRIAASADKCRRAAWPSGNPSSSKREKISGEGSLGASTGL